MDGKEEEKSNLTFFTFIVNQTSKELVNIFACHLPTTNNPN